MRLVMRLGTMGGFAALLLTGSADAWARGKVWRAEHPRRAEVNRRLDRQNTRINHDTTNKKMTYQESSRLKRQEAGIRQEERAMASEHHGHITRAEQRELNHQENHVRREIRHDERHPGSR
jgi:hypothetical protein